MSTVPGSSSELAAALAAKQRDKRSLTWHPYLPIDVKQDLQEIWDRLDTEKKGHVTLKQLHGALSAAAEKPISTEAVQAVTLRMDVTGRLGRRVSHADYTEYMAQQLLAGESYDQQLRGEQGQLITESGCKLFELLKVHKRKCMMSDAMAGSEGIKRLLALTQVPMHRRARRKGQVGFGLLGLPVGNSTGTGSSPFGRDSARSVGSGGGSGRSSPSKPALRRTGPSPAPGLRPATASGSVTFAGAAASASGSTTAPGAPPSLSGADHAPSFSARNAPSFSAHGGVSFNAGGATSPSLKRGGSLARAAAALAAIMTQEDDSSPYYKAFIRAAGSMVSSASMSRSGGSFARNHSLFSRTLGRTFGRSLRPDGSLVEEGEADEELLALWQAAAEAGGFGGAGGGAGGGGEGVERPGVPVEAVVGGKAHTLTMHWLGTPGRPVGGTGAANAGTGARPGSRSGSPRARQLGGGGSGGGARGPPLTARPATAEPAGFGFGGRASPRRTPRPASASRVQGRASHRSPTVSPGHSPRRGFMGGAGSGLGPGAVPPASLPLWRSGGLLTEVLAALEEQGLADPALSDLEELAALAAAAPHLTRARTPTLFGSPPGGGSPSPRGSPSASPTPRLLAGGVASPRVVGAAVPPLPTRPHTALSVYGPGFDGGRPTRDRAGAEMAAGSSVGPAAALSNELRRKRMTDGGGAPFAGVAGAAVAHEEWTAEGAGHDLHDPASPPRLHLGEEWNGTGAAGGQPPSPGRPNAPQPVPGFLAKTAAAEAVLLDVSDPLETDPLLAGLPAWIRDAIGLPPAAHAPALASASTSSALHLSASASASASAAGPDPTGRSQPDGAASASASAGPASAASIRRVLLTGGASSGSIRAPDPLAPPLPHPDSSFSSLPLVAPDGGLTLVEAELSEVAHVREERAGAGATGAARTDPGDGSGRSGSGGAAGLGASGRSSTLSGEGSGPGSTGGGGVGGAEQGAAPPLAARVAALSGRSSRGSGFRFVPFGGEVVHEAHEEEAAAAEEPEPAAGSPTAAQAQAPSLTQRQRSGSRGSRPDSAGSRSARPGSAGSRGGRQDSGGSRRRTGSTGGGDAGGGGSGRDSPRPDSDRRRSDSPRASSSASPAPASASASGGRAMSREGSGVASGGGGTSSGGGGAWRPLRGAAEGSSFRRRTGSPSPAPSPFSTSTRGVVDEREESPAFILLPPGAGASYRMGGGGPGGPDDADSQAQAPTRESLAQWEASVASARSSVGHGSMSLPGTLGADGPAFDGEGADASVGADPPVLDAFAATTLATGGRVSPAMQRQRSLARMLTDSLASSSTSRRSPSPGQGPGEQGGALESGGSGAAGFGPGSRSGSGSASPSASMSASHSVATSASFSVYGTGTGGGGGATPRSARRTPRQGSPQPGGLLGLSRSASGRHSRAGARPVPKLVGLGTDTGRGVGAAPSLIAEDEEAEEAGSGRGDRAGPPDEGEGEDGRPSELSSPEMTLPHMPPPTHAGYGSPRRGEPPGVVDEDEASSPVAASRLSQELAAANSTRLGAAAPGSAEPTPSYTPLSRHGPPFYSGPRPRSATQPLAAEVVAAAAAAALAEAEQQQLAAADAAPALWEAEGAAGAAPPAAEEGPPSPVAVRLNRAALLKMQVQYGSDMAAAAGAALGLGGTSAQARQVAARELLNALSSAAAAGPAAAATSVSGGADGGTDIAAGPSHDDHVMGHPAHHSHLATSLAAAAAAARAASPVRGGARSRSPSPPQSPLGHGHRPGSAGMYRPGSAGPRRPGSAGPRRPSSAGLTKPQPWLPSDALAQGRKALGDAMRLSLAPPGPSLRPADARTRPSSGRAAAAGRPLSASHQTAATLSHRPPSPWGVEASFGSPQMATRGARAGVAGAAAGRPRSALDLAPPPRTAPSIMRVRHLEGVTLISSPTPASSPGGAPLHPTSAHGHGAVRFAPAGYEPAQWKHLSLNASHQQQQQQQAAQRPMPPRLALGGIGGGAAGPGSGQGSGRVSGQGSAAESPVATGRSGGSSGGRLGLQISSVPVVRA
ncbi:hypothetical protein HYH03_017709 [Edaphochlamys debaryana]|uniref:EF-hand domain-containing protein n=1 Tax=Edaphochlamys debaryana TaxID=47281 RepID=A0A835XM17_9CHLO|nr:hypothetical protein HYH03_017709 [Edaphochlamys debaryana]|eukprot:KAG2483455.1 hypothetical protein HYH03_017709 [Edaphochlamys debaryana]